MPTSTDKLTNAIQRLARLTQEAGQIADAIAQIDGGADPLLTFASRQGDTYALPRNATRAMLATQQTDTNAKIAALQAKIDAAAGQV
jgi:glucose dehydrogenase